MNHDVEVVGAEQAGELRHRERRMLGPRRPTITTSSTALLRRAARASREMSVVRHGSGSVSRIRATSRATLPLPINTTRRSTGRSVGGRGRGGRCTRPTKSVAQASPADRTGYVEPRSTRPRPRRSPRGGGRADRRADRIADSTSRSNSNPGSRATLSNSSVTSGCAGGRGRPRRGKAVRHRQPLEDVDLHARALEQLVGRVHRGRARPDDRDPQRVPVARGPCSGSAVPAGDSGVTHRFRGRSRR